MGGGGSVQKIFDDYIISDKGQECWYNFFKKKQHYNYLVQDFFEQQLEPYLGIDIYREPFDKEKGFSIYKYGNVEIFIYQLEKLNSVFDKLAKFLEIENAQMVRSNDSKDKWYYEKYKDAEENIVLSREYFDKCYNGKYIKHFYSESDISKFKEKWESNIR